MAASSTSSAAASPSPAFTFEPVSRMFTCGLTEVRWTYTGNPAPLTLNISNINIAQEAPLGPLPTSPTSPTTTTVPRLRRQFNGYGGAYLPPINIIVTAGIDPTPGNWTWSAVTVPQGWYQMLAYVQGVLQTSSASFFVMNGTNTDCVVQYAVAPSTPANPNSSTSTSSTLVPPATNVASSSGHSHTAAIAGGVIGGIAFLAIAIAAFLFFCVRRRTPRSRRGDENRTRHRWSELSFRKSLSFARSSIQKPPPALPALEADQTFVGSEEEVSTVEHEKAIAAGQRSMPAYQPTRSQSLRTSTQTTGSHGYTASNAEPLARRASCSAHPGEAIPLERTHTAGGGATGPRRKPAPRYDGPEVEVGYTGRSSSQTTLDSIHGNAKGTGGPGGGHVLRHQSSFGAMRPMHVMMPDPPPAARR